MPDGHDTDAGLRSHLAGLERKGQYVKYVSLLASYMQPMLRAQDRSDKEKRQWRQLVVATNVFAVKYTEAEKHARALDMLRKALDLVQSDDGMPAHTKRELSGFVHDSYALYYFRRSKLSAALQSSHKATKAHASVRQWDHVAKCHLHTAAILSRLGKHGEAVRCMGQVLQLVDEERLEAGGASAEKLCLLSVAYHNIAVEHILLGQGEDACLASQNCRRLARLCLSYSNRYMRHFEATHAAALAQLQRSREARSLTMNDPLHRKVFRNLSAALYS